MTYIITGYVRTYLGWVARLGNCIEVVILIIDYLLRERGYKFKPENYQCTVIGNEEIKTLKIDNYTGYSPTSEGVGPFFYTDPVIEILINTKLLILFDTSGI